VYSILTVSGNPSWILAQNCTWDIDIVDIPNPDGNLYANVYSINDDTVILDSKQ
jgi:predicted membrane-bound spermidine synthase